MKTIDVPFSAREYLVAPGRLLALALVLGSFACRKDGGHAVEAATLAGPTATTRDSLVELTPAGDSSVRVVLGTTRFRLGSDTGSRPAEFGWVAAIEFMPDDGIAVLDPGNFRITRFAPTGDAIVSVGRRGEGPGELQQPEALSLLDSMTLLVLDSPARRLNRYAVSGSTLRFVSADQLEGWPGAVCSIAGAAVGLDYDHADGTILHRLTSGSNPPAAFGKPWFAERELNITGTAGELSCAPDQNLIVVASDRTGDVFGYGVDGSLRWRTHLQRYTPSLFKLVPNGSMIGFAPGQKYRDVTIGLVRLSRNFLIVQIGTKAYGKPYIGEFDSVQSRILRLQDGVEVGAQGDLPRIGAASRGQIATFGVAADVWVEVRRFHVEHDPAKPTAR